MRNLLLLLVLIFTSCDTPTPPIVELPPEEEVPTDTYCVVEEEIVSEDDTFFVHAFSLLDAKVGCFIGKQDLETELQEDYSKVRYYTSDGDVGEDVYDLYLEEPNGNYLEIDSINLVENYISGYFMASFQAREPLADDRKPWNPEYVRFFNGRFECEIIE